MRTSFAGAKIIKPGRFVGPDEVERSLSFLKAKAHGKVALIGGVALAYLGCPKMTRSVDIAALAALDLSPRLPRTLSFGGAAWTHAGEPEIKVVIRSDDFAALYQDAVLAAIPGPERFPTAPPEYLAAMKFAAQDVYHRLDLKWLLGHKGIVDREKLHKIVYDRVGGRFALDALEIIEEETELDKELDSEWDESSYP